MSKSKLSRGDVVVVVKPFVWILSRSKHDIPVGSIVKISRGGNNPCASSIRLPSGIFLHNIWLASYYGGIEEDDVAKEKRGKNSWYLQKYVHVLDVVNQFCLKIHTFLLKNVVVVVN